VDKILEFETGPESVVFLDIDGVVTDTRHREHFVASEPKDWESFFRAMNYDTLHWQGKVLYDQVVATGASVVYLTGRNEHYQWLTSRFLESHGFSLKWDLVMRPAGLSMPLAAWKREVLRMAVGQLNQAYIHPWWEQGFPVGGKHSAPVVTDSQVVIVDDDPKVIQAAGEAGFATVHATWQPKNPALINAEVV